MWPFGAKKISVPDRAWFNYELSANEFTPDIQELTSRRTNLFVYDRLQPQFPEFTEHLKDKIEGNAITAFTTDKFETVKANLGKESFPIPLPVNNQQIIQNLASPFRNGCRIPFAKVKGFIYNVPTDLIPKLDRMKRNGEQFARVRTPVVVPFKEVWRGKDTKKYICEFEKHQLVTVTMYVAVRDFWLPLLDGGFLYKPVQIYKYFGTSTGIKDYSYFDFNEECCK